MRRRQKIPSEGLAFRNKDEISAHFAARDAADKARMDERISRAKERMAKLQDVINGLCGKEERYLAGLEKGGKLPAKWRTPQCLEEDIFKERTKLEKLMQDIALLEQDLQDHSLVQEDELEPEGLTLRLATGCEKAQSRGHRHFSLSFLQVLRVTNSGHHC